MFIYLFLYLNQELSYSITQSQCPKKEYLKSEAKTPSHINKLPTTDNKNEKSQNMKKNQNQNKSKGEKPQKSKKAQAPAAEANVSLLEIKVGTIIDIQNHPDADTLYVEKVDFGSDTHKTILSGLRGKIDSSDLLGKKCLFVTNLKPVKMRGLLSEGMILVASSNEKLEPLSVPEDAVNGSLVYFSNYPSICLFYHLILLFWI